MKHLLEILLYIQCLYHVHYWVSHAAEHTDRTSRQQMHLILKPLGNVQYFMLMHLGIIGTLNIYYYNEMAYFNSPEIHSFLVFLIIDHSDLMYFYKSGTS